MSPVSFSPFWKEILGTVASRMIRPYDKCFIVLLPGVTARWRPFWAFVLRKTIFSSATSAFVLMRRSFAFSAGADFSTPPAPARVLFLNRFCEAKLSHSAEQMHNFVFSNAGQQAKRNPSCSCRIGNAVVICPKVALAGVAFGGFMFGMLSVLVPSRRN